MRGFSSNFYSIILTIISGKDLKKYPAQYFPKRGSAMHCRYDNLLASFSKDNYFWMTKSESISRWTKWQLIYLLPCRWLFLVVLMFHLRSGLELVWGGLNYSCIQRGLVSCLAGSNISCKGNLPVEAKATLLLLPLSSSIVNRADTSTCLSAC